MAVPYPSNPSAGDIFTISNVSYYYNGADWVLLGSISIDPALTAVQSTGTVTIDNLVVTGTLTADVDVTFDTNTFFVDSEENRVGINQQNPAYELDVTGTGRFTSGVIGNLTGNASTATTLETSRTINLTGVVSGSVSFDGSSNVSISTSLETITSDVVISGSDPQIKFNDTTASADDFWIHINSNNFYILADRGDDDVWETPHPLQLEADTNTSYTFGNRILTVADEGSGNGLDADTVDGVQASGFVSTTYNSSLNSDSRNSRGPTRLYRRDNNSDYSVQTYWTGARWRLYGYLGDTGHADTHVGYADSAGNADTTDGLHVHGGRNNEANKIVRTQANGYIDCGWINTPSGNESRTATRFYASADDYIRYLTQAQMTSQIVDGKNIYPASCNAGYLLAQKSTTSSAYQNQALQVFNPTNNGNSTAGLTFHVAGQLAPVFRSWPGNGAGFDAGNQSGTGYTWLGATQFIVRSSERFKKNITQKTDEEIIPSVLNALSARTVVFDDNFNDGYWSEEEQFFKEHETCDCEDCEDCNAIRNDPLQRIHFKRRGIIAEELAEVFPEAVHLDAEGIPNGIDYAVLTVELLDAVKLLVLQCENQERRIAELEAA